MLQVFECQADNNSIMNKAKNPLITLTTDFGQSDSYVAQMKGVIYGINSNCNCVDVTHQIASQDIVRAAYLLSDLLTTFPAGTVHLVVVDPGVGSARAMIAAEISDHYFVLPDNGLLSCITENYDLKNCIRLIPESSPAQSVSHTFHGRDVMAPAAAQLSLNKSISDLGPQYTQELIRFAIPEVVNKDEDLLGEVLWADHFGNLITNITAKHLETSKPGNVNISINGEQTCSLKKCYNDVPLGTLLAYIGSSGRLEIAIRNGNAAQVLGVDRRACVKVSLYNPS